MNVIKTIVFSFFLCFIANIRAQTIAEIISGFDKNQHSNQFYLDTAWEGLIKSNIYTWTSLSKQEQDRIKKVISDYINLNKNETCQ